MHTFLVSFDSISVDLEPLNVEISPHLISQNTRGRNMNGCTLAVHTFLFKQRLSLI